MITLNFIWHMHQPDYRHPATGEMILPWVRLHAVKGYCDLLDILERHDSFRCTVNFSGILLEQLDAYVRGEADELCRNLTRKRATDLTQDERLYILKHFFAAHRENMIKRYSRYYELLLKHEGLTRLGTEEQAAERFSDQEIADLTVLFNLAWIGFAGSRDERVANLAERGRGYTHEDQRTVLAVHDEIIKAILPRYRTLADDGRIELCFTPYHHPILPLIHDLSGEGHRREDDPLPEFRYAEDAREQVERGMHFYQQAFGQVPQGAWPAEGSVSNAALGTFAACGLNWVATDQQNLPQHINGGLSHLTPYRWERDGRHLNVFFRDTRLADNIGFEYKTWSPMVAGNHLVEMACEMAHQTDLGQPVVTIALDGENPWENYADGGEGFLNALVERIAMDHRVECNYPAAILMNRDCPVINDVSAGSWIMGNFDIWSRHPETRIAWRRLAQARRDLIDVAQGKVLDNLLAAEASDWFWWYGDDFVTEQAEQFDELFRGHLIAAYQAAGREVPDMMFAPIYTERRPEIWADITGLIEPKLDGQVTTFFEWRGAVEVAGDPAQVSMARSMQSSITSLWYGFSMSALFIRLDLSPDWRNLWNTNGGYIRVNLSQGECECLSEFTMEQNTIHATDGVDCAVDVIAEIRLSLGCADLRRGELAYLNVEMGIHNGPQTQFPSTGRIPIRIIPREYEEENWTV